MKEKTWVAGPVKRERPPKPRRIEWGWIAFVIVYLAVGAGLLWCIVYVMEGR